MHTLSLVLALESVTYSPPSSPETVMSDFYMLAWLGSINPEGLVKAGTTSALRLDLEDVRHAESVLYPKLREQLLSDVFFALSCELRHLFDNKQERPFSPFVWAYYRAWRSYTGAYKDPEMPPDRGKFADDQRGYQDSYAAVRKALETSNTQRPDAVAEMHTLFSKYRWNGAYGGRPWANIAAGWLRLYRATSLVSMAVAIDHVYDLQHNTDTVFNKLKRYYDSNRSHAWILKALDFKAKIKNIRELLPKCSLQMRRMALPVLKAAGVPGQGVRKPESDGPSMATAPPPQASLPSADGYSWTPDPNIKDAVILTKDGQKVGLVYPDMGKWGAAFLPKGAKTLVPLGSFPTKQEAMETCLNKTAGITKHAPLPAGWVWTDQVGGGAILGSPDGMKARVFAPYGSSSMWMADGLVHSTGQWNHLGFFKGKDRAIAAVIAAVVPPPAWTPDPKKGFKWTSAYSMIEACQYDKDSTVVGRVYAMVYNGKWAAETASGSFQEHFATQSEAKAALLQHIGKAIFWKPTSVSMDVEILWSVSGGAEKIVGMVASGADGWTAGGSDGGGGWVIHGAFDSREAAIKAVLAKAGAPSTAASKEPAAPSGGSPPKAEQSTGWRALVVYPPGETWVGGKYWWNRDHDGGNVYSSTGDESAMALDPWGDVYTAGMVANLALRGAAPKWAAYAPIHHDSSLDLPDLAACKLGVFDTKKEAMVEVQLALVKAGKAEAGKKDGGTTPQAVWKPSPTYPDTLYFVLGQKVIGAISKGKDGWKAEDAEGKTMGTFPTPKAAQKAVEKATAGAGATPLHEFGYGYKWRTSPVLGPGVIIASKGVVTVAMIRRTSEGWLVEGEFHGEPWQYHGHFDSQEEAMSWVEEQLTDIKI